MRRVSAVALILGCVAPVYGAPKVKITPVEVTETRAKQFAKTKFPSNTQLKLLVHVEGDGINDAASFGNVQISEATDNAKGNMKPKKKFVSSSGRNDFKSIRSGMLGMLQVKDEEGFRIHLELEPSLRKATKISRLKGTFQVLAGGEKKTVKVTKLTGLLGESLDDPILAEAGLKVRLLKPKSSDRAKTLSVEVKGDQSVLSGTPKLLDDRGKSASDSRWSGGSDKLQTYHLGLRKSLDDAMTLEINLVIGQKTLTVPFDLRNIELP